MRSRRYTVVIADRSSGVVRRATISVVPWVAAVLGIFALPILIGLGARWSVQSDLARLRTTNAALQVENGSYRVATGELTGQIQSLEDVINDLGEHATVDPEQARAMQKLPAVIKSRATGGAPANTTVSELSKLAMNSPEDTFGVLRDLLQGLETRLSSVRRVVERREELAAATPSIWPAHGWLTGTFGGRI